MGRTAEVKRDARIGEAEAQRDSTIKVREEVGLTGLPQEPRPGPSGECPEERSHRRGRGQSRQDHQSQQRMSCTLPPL